MKSNFIVESLGDHIKQFSLRNKDVADIEVFSVTNSKGFTLSTDYFSKEVFSKNVSNYKIVSRNQFAYNPSRINVGSIDYLRDNDKVLVSPLYIIFETDSKLNEDYLLRFLKSDWGNIQIRANTEGAVRDSLKFKGMEKIKIPLPPLDDQKRIAHLLGKVEGMIARRKQHLQQLDELLKSVFLEMFGDPVRNEKGWEKKVLQDICKTPKDIKCGPFGTQLNKSEFQENGVPVWGIPQINSEFKIPPSDFVTEFKALQLNEYSVIENDIVMSRKGSVGKCSIYPSTLNLGIMHSDVLRIRADWEKTNPIYLTWQFRISRDVERQIANVSHGAIMPGINVGKLKHLTIYTPPISLQNQFATIVENVESLKSRYQSSLSNLENLYGALSQKAFKGELDLGRVPLPLVEETENGVEVPVLPFDEGLSETMKKTLADLNKFNNSSASLRALQEATAINLESPAMKAAQMLAEQARLWKNPLDELKNMSSISRAMAELSKPSAITLPVEKMAAFQNTSKLAQQLAASMPKIDMSFIEQQKKLIESASRPFMEMQKTLANLNLARTTVAGAIDDSEAVARRLQVSIPDFTSWQQQYRTPEDIDTETEEEEPKHIFTRYDITDALAETEVLTFEELSVKLTELDSINLSSYERIRSILFELLGEGVLTQQFDEESQSLKLRLAE
jgi:type I restriction enzyme S subunit